MHDDLLVQYGGGGGWREGGETIVGTKKNRIEPREKKN